MTNDLEAINADRQERSKQNDNMTQSEMNRRAFIKLATSFGAAATLSPLFALGLPESAVAEQLVPLRLANPHTKERYEIQLFDGDRWNLNGLVVCNWMLRDWRQAKTVACDPKLFAALYVVQRKFNNDQFLTINSGYRSPETNAYLRQKSIARHGGRVTSEAPAVNSQHINARAVDFCIDNVSPVEVSRFVKKFLQNEGAIGGIGTYSTFTHMDTASVRQWGKAL